MHRIPEEEYLLIIRRALALQMKEEQNLEQTQAAKLEELQEEALRSAALEMGIKPRVLEVATRQHVLARRVRRAVSTAGITLVVSGSFLANRLVHSPTPIPAVPNSVAKYEAVKPDLMISCVTGPNSVMQNSTLPSASTGSFDIDIVIGRS
jgi:hypothetical protein